MGRIRVAVLMGGRSSEREVSLSSGRQVMGALDATKYEVVPIDCGQPGWLAALLPGDVGLPSGVTGSLPVSGRAGGEVGAVPPGTGSGKPDVALIILHGPYGEDGTIQGLLELVDIPYAGSGVLGSALTMDKAMTKRVLRAEGIPTPEGIVLNGPEEIDAFIAAWHAGEAGDDVPELPAVVKPNIGGSTIGVSVVRTPGEMAPALRSAARQDRQALIEAFIPGTEITAAVIGNRELQVLPLVEIVPQGGFYDYERKYTPGLTEEIVPARISGLATARAEEVALRAHRALECRGMSRVDMIVRGDEVTVLEVNTIPGMTPTSLLPRAAEAAGIAFPRLLDRLIELALEDAPGRVCREATAGCSR